MELTVKHTLARGCWVSKIQEGMLAKEAKGGDVCIRRFLSFELRSKILLPLYSLSTTYGRYVESSL